MSDDAVQQPPPQAQPQADAARAKADGGSAKAADPNQTPPSGEQTENSPEDKIGAARSDPLSEARATPDEIAAGKAYERFQQSVSAAGQVGVIGGATVAGGMHFYAAGSAGPAGSGRGAAASGPVRPDLIADITAWYAAAPQDGEIRSILRERRVVVLKGLRGSGRSTTAVKLLAEFTSGNVERFAAGSGLGELTGERIEPGHGYLSELRSADQCPDEAALDRLSGELSKQDSYCVLLPPVGEAGNCPAEYLREHQPPPVGTVLERRIEAACDDPRRVGAAGGRQDLAALGRDQELWQLVGADPGPAEEAWLAGLIVRLADGECDRPAALRSWTEPIDRRIGLWLADLPQGVDLHRHRTAVREFAFRLALAVLDDSPIHLVAEAGELLALELHTTANPRLTPGRTVFDHLDDDWLAGSRAQLRDGSLTVADASVPAQLLDYRDDRLPVRFLAAVWGGRPNLRLPILRWLQNLSKDRRPGVWMRAALTIGLVTSWDFTYSYHAAIEPWAGSKDLKERMVAAAALNQAARDTSTSGAVATLMRGWARGSDAELMTTAALTFSYGPGDGSAAGSGNGAPDLISMLKLLRRIGVWEEGRLALLASKAVSDLFARGHFDQVLTAVDGWIGDRRVDEHTLGLLVVARLGDLRVRHVPNLCDLPLGAEAREALADPARAGWPLVVAVAQYGGTAGRLLVECVWQALSSSLASDLMVAEIGDWIRAADKSPGLLLPLGAFLRGLIDDENDEARLLHLVEMLTADPDEPLPVRVGHAVLAAIRQSPAHREELEAASV